MKMCNIQSAGQRPARAPSRRTASKGFHFDHVISGPGETSLPKENQLRDEMHLFFRLCRHTKQQIGINDGTFMRLTQVPGGWGDHIVASYPTVPTHAVYSDCCWCTRLCFLAWLRALSRSLSHPRHCYVGSDVPAK